MESGVKQIKKKIHALQENEVIGNLGNKVDPCQVKRETFQKLHGHFKIIDWRHVRRLLNDACANE
jgi:hypothetical protein